MWRGGAGKDVLWTDLSSAVTLHTHIPARPPPPLLCSRCGNFGLVGSESGRVDRYNMQSGQHRGAYCRSPAAYALVVRRSAPGVPAPAALLGDPGVTAHDGPVTGICSGGCACLCGGEGCVGGGGVRMLRKVEGRDLSCSQSLALEQAQCSDAILSHISLLPLH